MNNFNIPIFKLNFGIKSKIKFLLGAWDILSSGRPLGESKYTKEFEDRFSEMSNSKFALACSNGTTAIELALKAINVKNKKVLIPSNTFFATSVAVTNAGGIIELLDIESESFSIHPVDLENKISSEVGAVIIVHIGGIISPNIKKILRICKKHKVPLIEDAAHAHFSVRGNDHAGTIGDIGTFSFFPTKVMTTGEGGMITTNNKKLYEKMKSLKNFGRDNSDGGLIINAEGNNFKINEFTSLLGCVELDRVENRIKRRSILLDRYIKNLKGTSYRVLKQSEEGVCANYKAIVVCPMDSNFLKSYCKENNITLTGEVYKIPIHHQPLYKECFSYVNLPNTDYYYNHHICPPLYPELTFEEVDYICDVLKKALKEYEK